MFNDKSAEINQRDDARKKQIHADDAWEIIRKYKTVLVSKGKKTIEYQTGNENRDDILKAVLGRSGNLRAPSIEIDGKLIVGYNEALYNGF